MHYTAGNNDKAPVHSFDVRGLAHLKPIKPSDVRLYGYNKEFKPLFDKTMSDPVTTTLATLTNKVYVVPVATRKLLGQVKPHLIDRPIMTGIFNNLTSEQLIKLQTSKLTPDATNKNMWQGTPSWKHLKDYIVPLAPQGKFSPGSVTVNGYIAYYQINRGLRLLASLTETANSPFDMVRLDIDNLPQTYDLKGDGKIPVLFGTGTSEGIAQSVTVANTLVPLQKMGSVAVPLNSSKDVTKGMVSINTIIPTSNGYVFPYFQGLMMPDRAYLADNVLIHLLPFFGDTIADANTFYQTIRDDIRDMASLPCGMVFSHMFLGINLAKQAKASVRFIIQQDIYRGFVIQSNTAVIALNGSILEHTDEMNLSTEIASLDAHGRALQSIVDIITSWKVDGAAKYEIVVDDIITPRGLNKVMRNIQPKSDFTDLQWTAIAQHVEKLSYDQTFYEPTAEHLVAFLTYCLSFDLSLIEDAPMYYQGNFWRTENMVELGLLMFGSKAPSFRLGGNLVIRIPNTLNVLDNNLVVDPKKTVAPLRYFAYRMKGIIEAASDFVTLFDTGAILYPKGPTEDAWIDRKKVSGVVTHADGVHAIYKALKDVVVKHAGGIAGSKEKRKRIVEGVDDSKSSKKMREKRVQSANIMANLM